MDCILNFRNHNTVHFYSDAGLEEVLVLREAAGAFRSRIFLWTNIMKTVTILQKETGKRAWTGGNVCTSF